MARVLAVLLFCVGLLVIAQSPRAQLMNFGIGGGGVGGGAGYTGPGNVSGWSTMAMWGSCARGITASYASGGGNACDIVDTATGGFSCTMKLNSTGFVNLTSPICTSNTLSVTTFCTVTHAAGCSVATIYDQTGNGNNWTQATLAKMPLLVFSSPNSGTQPCINWPSDSAAFFLETTTAPSLPQPLTFTMVLNHASGATAAANAIMGDGNTVNFFDGTLGTNTYATFAGGTNGTVTITDAAYHAIQNVWDDTNSLSAVYHDGTNTAYTGGPIGTAGFVNSATIGYGVNGTNLSFLGTICELGVNSFSANSTQKSAMNSNQHGLNGYNF